MILIAIIATLVIARTMTRTLLLVRFACTQRELIDRMHRRLGLYNNSKQQQEVSPAAARSK